MIIIAAESITALIYLYLWASLPWSSWHSWPGAAQELHYLVVIVGAVVVGQAAVRRRGWGIKAAAILAAYVGLPNLLSLGYLIPAIGAGFGVAITGSLVLLVTGAFAQLAAFLHALRVLSQPSAAA